MTGGIVMMTVVNVTLVPYQRNQRNRIISSRSTASVGRSLLPLIIPRQRSNETRCAVGVTRARHLSDMALGEITLYQNSERAAARNARVTLVASHHRAQNNLCAIAQAARSSTSL